jgi:signal transduction histidine kinase
VWTLASPLVDAHQLSAALADHVRGFSTRTGIPASYQHDGPAPPLDHGATTQIVRILLEALHNVEKHAQAHSVTIRSCTTSDRFELSIDDDGVGFAPQAPQENGTGSGFGLLSLHERARLAGGMLEVRSAPGEGTAVVVSVPNTREN